MINRNRKGAFADERAMDDLLTKYDLNVTADLQRMLTDVTGQLLLTSAGTSGDLDDLERQLRRPKTPEQLYSLLFELGYLEPRYALRINDRELPQLTPGERGSVLLVFYLVIDQDSRPLLIDQPEENLDNQSVYELLAPCVNEARRRRQIILVTHNPNLAVVCNAEQVIWCKIAKESDQAVTYTAGGLENPVISKHVIDVLEGTWPAFRDREGKYQTRSGSLTEKSGP